MAAWSYVNYMVIGVLVASCASKDPVIQLPAECKSEGFCSLKPDGYQLLEDMINNALPKYLKEDYENRIGFETGPKSELSPESDWHNCPYITTTESMYLYNHGQNETKTDIIVQTKLFKQEITTVRCAHEKISTGDQECFQDLDLDAFGMKTACQTIYADRSLYVFDLQKKEIVRKGYPLPVCCSCAINYKD